jgi:type II secretory pathway pseudopilin PulG
MIFSPQGAETMHKRWIALLPIAGLAGAAVPAVAQTTKDAKTKAEKDAAAKAAKQAEDAKLKVKQETLRQQNQPNAGKTLETGTCAPGDKAITKGKSQLTKGKAAPAKDKQVQGK